RLSPEAAAALPSSVMAHLAVTYGRPVDRSFRYGALSRRAASPSRPSSTITPASASRAKPPPATFGNGARIAAPPRAIPALWIASVHGGVLPKWQHGSSET